MEGILYNYKTPFRVLDHVNITYDAFRWGLYYLQDRQVDEAYCALQETWSEIAELETLQRCFSQGAYNNSIEFTFRNFIQNTSNWQIRVPVHSNHWVDVLVPELTMNYPIYYVLRKWGMENR